MIIRLCFSNQPIPTTPIDLGPVVVLTAGIAPTLAIVRAQFAKLCERANPETQAASPSRLGVGELRTIPRSLSLQIRRSGEPGVALQLPESPGEARIAADLEKGMGVLVR
ncbi:hypothetical protein V5O48_007621 [Marasmius crinis-equi]|uniref:Uncharacterized protein n=1 Tax=Marasmius crinis-equi TaxID=585013 RepID=A0ABR3FG55_9AGAR